MAEITTQQHEVATDHLAKAAEAFTNGHFTTAADEYRAHLSGHPASSDAFRGLGLSLLRLGDNEGGLDACRKAAEVSPTNAENRYALGYALGSVQRLEEAIPELDAALALQPNHMSARNAVVFCLVTVGGQLSNDDPEKAGNLLERAHRIDPKNPDTTAALLSHYFGHDQPRKVLKVLQALDAAQRSHPTIKPFVERLEMDPVMASALKAGTADAPKPVAAATPTFKQVPCPSCHAPIADFAAICPHCGFQNRAVGRFAGRDTGPNVIWQDVVYMILAVLWTGMSGLAIWASMQIEIEGLRMALCSFYGLRLLVGVGMILQMEWVAFVAKIMCYLSLFAGARDTLIGFGLGRPLDGCIGLATLGIAGLLIYLINFKFD